MEEMEKILIKIEELRQYLHSIISNENNLLDDQTIHVSKELDRLLNEYHALLKKKEGKL